jgi:SAM-dependent methyltransferase
MRKLVEGEYAFFDYEGGEVPYYSSQEFHDDREHAPHIEEHGMQRDRLILAGEFVKDIINNDPSVQTVSDLCCGDGGLLQHLNSFFAEKAITAYGYEYSPDAVRHANYVRNVNVVFADVANDDIEIGDVAILTECLEHFHKPHEMVEKVAEQAKYIVISSPNGEVPEAHYELHTWGWSWPAYENLITQAGFEVFKHQESSIFQVLTGVRK